MVRRFCCGLAILALAACAGGEDDTGASGFGNTALTIPAPTTASASATSGMSSTSAPTTSDSASDSASVTTEFIRPDMGDPSSSSGPDVTTGVTATTTTDPTDPSGTTTTTGPVIACGDGVIEGTEECEGANLNGQSCSTLGFTGGTLTCAANCAFDKRQCVSESCGDAIKNGGEECDCGQQQSPCTPAQLGDVACANILAPSNGNYHGGTLTCGSPQSCLFNTSACIYCGDGARNGPEACEGGDLGGQTCVGLGFTSGSLSCNANCTHNTGGCMNAFCGDGTCNAGEDSCSCPADCPDNPNSCSPCQCGGMGGPFCYCDAICIQAGDCCIGGPC